MADKQKKKAAPKRKTEKAKKFQAQKPPKHDGILYAHVKSKNVAFLKGKAKAQEVSLSVFMDQLTDKLAAGEAVKV